MTAVRCEGLAALGDGAERAGVFPVANGRVGRAAGDLAAGEAGFVDGLGAVAMDFLAGGVSFGRFAALRPLALGVAGVARFTVGTLLLGPWAVGLAAAVGVFARAVFVREADGAFLGGIVRPCLRSAVVS